MQLLTKGCLEEKVPQLLTSQNQSHKVKCKALLEAHGCAGAVLQSIAEHAETSRRSDTTSLWYTLLIRRKHDVHAFAPQHFAAQGLGVHVVQALARRIVLHDKDVNQSVEPTAF